jgi:hypothetical protein
VDSSPVAPLGASIATIQPPAVPGMIDVRWLV